MGDTTSAPGPTPLTTATGPGTACTSVSLMLSQRLMLTGQATTTDTPTAPGPTLLTTAATTGQATTTGTPTDGTGLPTTPTTGHGTVTTVTSDVTLTTIKTAMTAK